MALRDIFMGSAATVALFLVYVSFPLIGMLAGLISSTPGIFYMLKSGRVVGYGIVFISAALLFLATDDSVLVIYLLQCAIMTAAIPEFILRRKGGARAIVYAAAVNVVVIFIGAALFSVISGIDLNAQVQKGVASSIEQTVGLYEKTGIGSEDLNSLRQGMKQAGALISKIYPALVAIGLGMVACINLFLLSKVAKRYPIPLALGAFSKYKNPDPLIWVLILAGFAMLVNVSWISMSALNCIIVLAALYSVQGMAIIRHYFVKYAVPVFVRALFYFLLAVQPFMAVAVAILGVFDLWGDFRSPKQQENL